MEKIDRLGWAAGISITSYGVRVGIRVNEPAILDRVCELLPPAWKPAPSGAKVERLYSLVVGGEGARSGLRRFNLLYADAERLVRTHDLDEVLNWLETDLCVYVAEAARRKVFIHSGVVGWKGRAILIPGKSMSGKTTLVAELVKAGATYYSDEYAVLDSKGRVHPYARPLAVREEPRARSRKYAVEELGGEAGTKPLPVGLIIMSEYKTGARWRPRPVTAGQGALALLSNTLSARSRPAAALATLGQVVLRAPVLKGVRGEAEEVVASIMSGAAGRALADYAVSR